MERLVDVPRVDSVGRRERNYAEIDQRLWDAGRALAVEFGISEVTVEMIAERADVAGATFYSHFESTELFWDQLRDSADEWVFDMVRGAVTQEYPAHINLAKVVKAAVDRATEAPVIVLFMLSLNATVGEQFGPFDQLTASLIAEGVEDGLFGAVRDPELAAVMYRTAMLVAVNSYLLKEDSLVWKDMVYLGLQLLGTDRSDITDAVSVAAGSDWEPNTEEVS